MGVDLAELPLERFSAALAAACGAPPLETAVVARLYSHYEELRRWSPRLGLIGRGTAEAAIERHYAESLAGLPLLGACRRLVDIGSGAGFPGWILAAARPDIDVWLVESNRRKAAFLRTAFRRAALPGRVLDARVGPLLPPDFPPSIDLVTVRAVRLRRREWRSLDEYLSASCRILRWVGPSPPLGPAGWKRARSVAIAASDRAVEELVRVVPRGGRP